LNAFVWEDASAQVWPGYNDPEYLAKRHGATQRPAVEKLRKALGGIAEAVVAR